MKKIAKMIIGGVGILIAVLFVANLFFYLFQDKILFQSKPLTQDFKFDFPQKFQEFFIPFGENEVINALFFPSSETTDLKEERKPSKGLLIYFHGNADNLERWGKYAVDFTKLGFDILMIDYSGYGKSSGKSTEKKLYQNAETVWEWTKKEWNHYDKKVIYGRSLGTGVATFLASKNKADLVILETPFDNLKGTMLYYSPLIIVPFKYKFPNKKHLSQITSDIVIFHGTNDWVVPLTSAVKLKPLLKKNDKFIIIEGGGHKNLRDFPLYHKKLEEIMPSLSLIKKE